MTKKLTFEEAYEFIKKVEGGYVDHKNDKGGKTNYGVTQYIYNLYKDSQNEPRQDVKNISEEEIKALYKDIFWDKSAASRIQNPDQALIYFDTAVNSGEGKARELYQKSNGNIEEFLELRRKNYEQIIQKDPSQKVFEKGWNNRLNKLEDEIVKRNKIFTSEEIGKMSNDEYQKNEKAIFHQMSTIGIPSNQQLKNSKSSSGSGQKSGSSSSGDGHWVTINGNHVFIEK